MSSPPPARGVLRWLWMSLMSPLLSSPSSPLMLASLLSPSPPMPSRLQPVLPRLLPLLLRLPSQLAMLTCAWCVAWLRARPLLHDA